MRSTCSRDLHLAENTPRAFEAWAAHLRAHRADAVFILGDLFEVWIGDDMAERGFEARCVEVLRAAAAQRTVAFMAGNRDFLVGDAMLEASGVAAPRRPDRRRRVRRARAAVARRRLCIDDVAYQRYRAGGAPAGGVQRAFGALPLATRRADRRAPCAGAAAARAAGEPAAAIDVDDEPPLAWMREADAPTLVHGHTHAPASHELGARRRAATC